MCQKRNSTEIPYRNQHGNFAKVDDCIAKQITELNKEALASCCGHGRYKKSIVVLYKDGITRMEYFTKKIILRKRRFYKKDKQGYYYIPEIKKDGTK